mgnify:CR=1 FL=1
MTPLNEIINIDKIKEIIVNSYSISEPFDCTFIRRSFNDHYLIQTNDDRYILRVYLNNKYYINSISDFSFELDLLDFIASKNIPVSHPIRNKEKQFTTKFFYNNETRLITLFTFAEGVPINTTLEKNLAMRFGEIIADLHKKFNEFKSEHQRYKIDIDYLISEPIKMLQVYSNKHGLENLNFFEPYIKYLYSQLRELPVNNEAYGIIHDDLNPSNIHIDNSGNITVFDFDHCAYGWRIHDLAVIKLCYDKNTYEAILEGYINKKDISETEVQLIGLYAETLIIRKFKDVLSMLKICNNDRSKNFNEREFVCSAIVTLHKLMEK